MVCAMQSQGANAYHGHCGTDINEYHSWNQRKKGPHSNPTPWAKLHGVLAQQTPGATGMTAASNSPADSNLFRLPIHLSYMTVWRLFSPLTCSRTSAGVVAVAVAVALTFGGCLQLADLTHVVAGLGAGLLEVSVTASLFTKK